MTAKTVTRKRTKVAASLSALMDQAELPADHNAVPASQADFRRLVALAERDLAPAQRGRPANGVRGAITRTKSIRAPEALWSQVEGLAKRRGVSSNQAVVLALEALIAG